MSGSVKAVELILHIHLVSLHIQELSAKKNDVAIPLQIAGALSELEYWRDLICSALTYLLTGICQSGELQEVIAGFDMVAFIVS